MLRLRFLRRAAALAGVLAAVTAIPVTAQQQRPLSPRDTVHLQVAGGGHVMVDYGRPSMRGRKIMGELVPFGRVWRTGANEATALVTDVDLRIGGVAVPRGSYTLYTLPNPEGWLLIVNRQTGQWGTQYNQERDLARIPLRVTRLQRPVEQFTIALQPGGTPREGTLSLSWENTRASVPFEVVGAPAKGGAHSGHGQHGHHRR